MGLAVRPAQTGSLTLFQRLILAPKAFDVLFRMLIADVAGAVDQATAISSRLAIAEHYAIVINELNSPPLCQ